MIKVLYSTVQVDFELNHQDKFLSLLLYVYVLYSTN